MYHSSRKAVIDQLIEVGGLNFGEFLHKVTPDIGGLLHLVVFAINVTVFSL